MHLEAPPELLCFGVTLNLVWQEGTEPDGRGWWGLWESPSPHLRRPDSPDGPVASSAGEEGLAA